MRLLALALFLTSACTTLDPVHGVTLQKDTGAQCIHHCNDLDMRMSAVVIISNMTGCVCEPRDGKIGQAGGAAAASGGAMAAIMAAEEQQAQQSQPEPSPH